MLDKAYIKMDVFKCTHKYPDSFSEYFLLVKLIAVIESILEVCCSRKQAVI